ncbi:hypothetical protein JQC92_19430 [Shewanella sp. 202IG2-18]|uniref:hypothetical protein n=1 Tax=Parashewanella hymeniacidonis TaxID=2807618 RepID=UPI0019606BE6|nr:hypothetical protein [Parashewanella hymeniacidonis]MBM7074174.1 hypothetical protein [Parashewanella hymeniacidonis]
MINSAAGISLEEAYFQSVFDLGVAKANESFTFDGVTMSVKSHNGINDHSIYQVSRTETSSSLKSFLMRKNDRIPKRLQELLNTQSVKYRIALINKEQQKLGVGSVELNAKRPLLTVACCAGKVVSEEGLTSLYLNSVQLMGLEQTHKRFTVSDYTFLISASSHQPTQYSVIVVPHKSEKSTEYSERLRGVVESLVNQTRTQERAKKCNRQRVAPLAKADLVNCCRKLSDILMRRSDFAMLVGEGLCEEWVTSNADAMNNFPAHQQQHFMYSVSFQQGFLHSLGLNTRKPIPVYLLLQLIQYYRAENPALVELIYQNVSEQTHYNSKLAIIWDDFEWQAQYEEIKTFVSQKSAEFANQFASDDIEGELCRKIKGLGVSIALAQFQYKSITCCYYVGKHAISCDIHDNTPTHEHIFNASTFLALTKKMTKRLNDPVFIQRMALAHMHWARSKGAEVDSCEAEQVTSVLSQMQQDQVLSELTKDEDQAELLQEIRKALILLNTGAANNSTVIIELGGETLPFYLCYLRHHFLLKSKQCEQAEHLRKQVGSAVSLDYLPHQLFDIQHRYEYWENEIQQTMDDIKSPRSLEGVTEKLRHILQSCPFEILKTQNQIQEKLSDIETAILNQEKQDEIHAWKSKVQKYFNSKKQHKNLHHATKELTALITSAPSQQLVAEFKLTTELEEIDQAISTRATQVREVLNDPVAVESALLTYIESEGILATFDSFKLANVGLHISISLNGTQFTVKALFDDSSGEITLSDEDRRKAEAVITDIIQESSFYSVAIERERKWSDSITLSDADYEKFATELLKSSMRVRRVETSKMMSQNEYLITRLKKFPIGFQFAVIKHIHSPARKLFLELTCLEAEFAGFPHAMANQFNNLKERMSYLVWQLAELEEYQNHIYTHYCSVYGVVIDLQRQKKYDEAIQRVDKIYRDPLSFNPETLRLKSKRAELVQLKNELIQQYLKRFDDTEQVIQAYEEQKPQQHEFRTLTFRFVFAGAEFSVNEGAQTYKVSIHSVSVNEVKLDNEYEKELLEKLETIFEDRKQTLLGQSLRRQLKMNEEQRVKRSLAVGVEYTDTDGWVLIDVPSKEIDLVEMTKKVPMQEVNQTEL